MAIRLTKQLKTPPRNERVVIADLLLREAMQMVEITENGAMKDE